MCRSRQRLTIVVHAGWREFAAPFVSRRPGRRSVEEKLTVLDGGMNLSPDLVDRDFRPVANCGIDRAAPGAFEKAMFQHCRLHCAKARANPPLPHEVGEGCR